MSRTLGRCPRNDRSVSVPDDTTSIVKANQLWQLPREGTKNPRESLGTTCTASKVTPRTLRRRQRNHRSANVPGDKISVAAASWPQYASGRQIRKISESLCVRNGNRWNPGRASRCGTKETIDLLPHPRPQSGGRNNESARLRGIAHVDSVSKTNHSRGSVDGRTTATTNRRPI